MTENIELLHSLLLQNPLLGAADDISERSAINLNVVKEVVHNILASLLVSLALLPLQLFELGLVLAPGGLELLESLLGHGLGFAPGCIGLSEDTLDVAAIEASLVSDHVAHPGELALVESVGGDSTLLTLHVLVVSTSARLVTLHLHFGPNTAVRLAVIFLELPVVGAAALSDRLKVGPHALEVAEELGLLPLEVGALDVIHLTLSVSKGLLNGLTGLEPFEVAHFVGVLANLTRALGAGLVPHLPGVLPFLGDVATLGFPSAPPLGDLDGSGISADECESEGLHGV